MKVLFSFVYATRSLMALQVSMNKTLKELFHKSSAATFANMPLTTRELSELCESAVHFTIPWFYLYITYVVQFFERQKERLINK